VKLPAIYVKKGNFSHFKEALSWMNNILAGVKQGEEHYSHADLYTRGLEVVDCAVRNFTSEQIFELKEPLSDILKHCSSASNYQDMFEL